MAMLAELRCGWFRIRSPPADDRFLTFNGQYLMLHAHIQYHKLPTQHAICWVSFYLVVLMIVSSRPRINNDLSLKKGCWELETWLELFRPARFNGG